MKTEQGHLLSMNEELPLVNLLMVMPARYDKQLSKCMLINFVEINEEKIKMNTVWASWFHSNAK